MFGDRDEAGADAPEKDVVSVVGPGMEIEGDCRCDGSLRIDGRVHGTIRSRKSVVVGENGAVEGDILTQDAVVAGHVVGSIRAESRLELRDGCQVEGDIRSPIVRLEEGGHLDGEVDMSVDGSEGRDTDAEPAAARSRDSGRREGTAPAPPAQS